jgi:hypothetical protein
MALTSSYELLANVKRRPGPDSAEYRDFWREEKRKCIEGVTINGFHLSGWLYWHTNIWTIMVDYLDPFFGPVKKEGLPDLRDDDWDFDERSTLAEQQRKGMICLGRRNIGKSYWQASKAGYAATFIKGSENIVSAGNDTDLSRITTKIDLGLRNVPDAWLFDRINDDWRKKVVLGVKEKSGKRRPYSSIEIVNLHDGLNTEGFAGSRVKVLIIDEIGKFPVLKAYMAAQASFATKYGWMCVPYLMGTGGDFKNGTEAWEMFSNPDAYNLISMQRPRDGKIFGFYLLGDRRNECKVETTVADQFKLSDGGIWTKVPFHVSDVVAGRQFCLDARDRARQANDPEALLKEMMYYPLEVEEILLQSDGNDYPLEALRNHLEYLLAKPQGQAVRLFRNGDGTVGWKGAEMHDQPIAIWPVKKDTRKDAPVMIYEPPMDNPPAHLYIAGGDPYNQSSSDYSSSLGTIYIYKRIYDLIDGTYQDHIVASYAARPDSIDNWHETVELLLEYYNAVCMPENEGGTFIQHFDKIHKGYLLADGMSFLKEIHPDTTITNRNKGLPATTPVIDFCMSLYKRYLTEKIQTGTNPITKEPIFSLGLVRIPDPMLIIETINYKKDKKVKGLFDRIVAMRHVLAYNESLKKYHAVVEIEPELPAVRITANLGPFTMHKNSSKIDSPFIGGNRRRS